jgi:hypothetical protein
MNVLIDRTPSVSADTTITRGWEKEKTTSFEYSTIVTLPFKENCDLLLFQLVFVITKLFKIFRMKKMKLLRIKFPKTFPVNSLLQQTVKIQKNKIKNEKRKCFDSSPTKKFQVYSSLILN